MRATTIIAALAFLVRASALVTFSSRSGPEGVYNWEDAATWDYDTVPTGQNVLVIVNATSIPASSNSRVVAIQSHVRLLGAQSRLRLQGSAIQPSAGGSLEVEFLDIVGEGSLDLQGPNKNVTVRDTLTLYPPTAYPLGYKTVNFGLLKVGTLVTGASKLFIGACELLVSRFEIGDPVTGAGTIDFSGGGATTMRGATVLARNGNPNQQPVVSVGYPQTGPVLKLAGELTNQIDFRITSTGTVKLLPGGSFVGKLAVYAGGRFEGYVNQNVFPPNPSPPERIKGELVFENVAGKAELDNLVLDGSDLTVVPRVCWTSPHSNFNVTLSSSSNRIRGCQVSHSGAIVLSGSLVCHDCDFKGAAAPTRRLYQTGFTTQLKLEGTSSLHQFSIIGSGGVTGVQIAADSAAELHQMHFHEATVNLMETSTARFTGLTTWTGACALNYNSASTTDAITVEGDFVSNGLQPFIINARLTTGAKPSFMRWTARGDLVFQSFNFFTGSVYFENGRTDGSRVSVKVGDDYEASGITFATAQSYIDNVDFDVKPSGQLKFLINTQLIGAVKIMHGSRSSAIITSELEAKNAVGVRAHFASGNFSFRAGSVLKSAWKQDAEPMQLGNPAGGALTHFAIDGDSSFQLVGTPATGAGLKIDATGKITISAVWSCTAGSLIRGSGQIVVAPTGTFNAQGVLVDGPTTTVWGKLLWGGANQPTLEGGSGFSAATTLVLTAQSTVQIDFHPATFQTLKLGNVVRAGVLEINVVGTVTNDLTILAEYTTATGEFDTVSMPALPAGSAIRYEGTKILFCKNKDASYCPGHQDAVGSSSSTGDHEFGGSPASVHSPSLGLVLASLLAAVVAAYRA